MQKKFKHETFPNAPITEALIDLRATFGGEVDLEQLEALAGEFAKKFPVKEPRIEHSYELKVEGDTGDAETHARSKRIGYVLFSEDRGKAIQLRVNGFSFSKMKPYEDWISLRDEAQKHWEIYRDTMKPNRVARLAVRYINRIEIPLPIDEFENYILTGPNIAEGVPQGVNEFFFRLVIPSQEDARIQAVVTSTIEKPSENGETLPYIFDIDAFTPTDLDPTSKGVWATLEKLRDYKNLIFFKSTTDKAKELFR
jgi:uncharacterized protein (TIGR04255 family)